MTTRYWLFLLPVICFLICQANAEVTTSRIELEPFLDAEFSGGVIPPRAVEKILPEYPDSALLDGVEGSATAQVLVDTNGNVAEIEVLSVPLETYSFEDAVETALQQWQFEPARSVIDDRAAEVWVALTLEFEIMAEDLLKKADETFNSRQYEESRGIFMKALEEAQSENNTSVQVEAMSQIARSYLIVGEKEPGREWLDKAKELASPDDSLGWSRYLGVRGRFEWQDGDLDGAKATFVEMYDYCSQRDMHSRAIDAAHMVAIVGTPEEQIEWGKKGIAEAKAGNVERWLGPLWNNLGATYEDQKMYDKAVDAYKQARHYHWLYGDEMNKLIADWAVGHAYRLAGDHEEAGKWLRPVLAWCERIDASEFLGWTHKDLGEIALAEGNDAQAKEHFEIALDHLKAAGMNEWDPDGFADLKKKAGE